MEVMKKLGNFAFTLWKSESHRFERDEVIREVDENVFKYGFLVGHQDFTLTAADVRVEFLHDSVFLYFVMFYFSQIDLLNPVKDLKHADKMGPTICTIAPERLHFYLWLVKNANIVPDGDFKKGMMQMQFVDAFNVRTLNWAERFKPPFARNISEAHEQNDEFVLSFLRSVLSECDKVECLYLNTDDPVDWILESLRHLNGKIQLIKIMNEENIIADVKIRQKGFFRQE